MSFRSALSRLSGIVPQRTTYSRVLRFRSIAYSHVRHHVASSGSADDEQPEYTQKSLFRAFFSSSSPAQIHNILQNVLKVRRPDRDNQLPTPVTHEQIAHVLVLLGERGSPTDLQAIDSILARMAKVFHVQPTVETYCVIVRSFMRAERPENLAAIVQWVLDMPTKRFYPAGSIEPFHVFFDGCARICADPEIFHSFLGEMRSHGCQPTVDTFAKCVIARWAMFVPGSPGFEAPDPAFFAMLMEHMEQLKMPYNPSFSSLLHDRYVAAGMPTVALEVRETYEVKFNPDRSPKGEEERRVQELLHLISKKARTEGVLNAVQALKTSGRAGSAQLLGAVLRHVTSLDDLLLVDNELRTEASHWALVMDNNLKMNDLQGALDVYNEALDRTLSFDAASIAPLIHALCKVPEGGTDPLDMNRARSIYELLVYAHQPLERPPDAPPYGGPMVDIFADLLRGIAVHSRPEQLFNFAQTLIKDLARWGVPLEKSDINNSIIILCMRVAEDADYALLAYEKYATSLTLDGCKAVLMATATLINFTPGVPTIPVQLYFDLVRSMRDLGFRLGVEVYAIIFDCIAQRISDMNPVHLDNPRKYVTTLITTTRHVHDVMALDANIPLDIDVWNRLMAIYARLGCFGDAIRVWQTMYLSGAYNNQSVSIVLDVCGSAGSWGTARQVVARLFAEGFEFDLRNWRSWIQCLCRLGKFDEALQVLCVQMQSCGVEPDVTCVIAILQHTKQLPFEFRVEINDRIKQHHPDLYKQVPTRLR
ncbi:hypothetical protein FISHEDRAFT_70925 [Fistulina hepatica ATCC 64428]|uniref:Pentacotripeptide-repeat region of PRORP domain-containing protein n=1 Tax=Fistulina hepatica ATCC 64428 TaxID=1128425 RepID=A0A0D7AJ14_9AGAR|nr:hypothetical protein FISHEDRAFT_70925 [Fistulina hepatica ATCC 64428]